LEDLYDFAGEVGCACSAAGEGFGEGEGCVVGLAEVLEGGELFVGVFGEAVDGDDGGEVEAADDTDVFAEIGEAAFEIAFALAADALHGGDEDGGGGDDAGGRGDEVHVLLEAEVGGEAGFVDDVVGEAETHLLGEDGAGAVGDVGEGAAVDEGGCAFGGLDEVREDGFGEERHHRPGGAEVGCGDGLAGAGGADDDAGETGSEIFAAGGEGEDRHDLGGGGDEEAGGAVGAVAVCVFGGDGEGDTAEGAVVHVEGARPGDGGGVDVEGVAMEEVRVDEGGEEVVGAGDGVEVAVEVEVDFFGWLDLGVASACCSALHAEDWAEGGFAGGDDGTLADVFEALNESDGGDGFAFAGDGGGGSGDEDHAAARGEGRVGEEAEGEFGSVASETLDEGVGEVEFGCDGFDGEEGFGYRLCGGHDGIASRYKRWVQERVERGCGV